jgi:hypothetical protein
VKAQNKHTISILIFIRVDVFMRVDPSGELLTCKSAIIRVAAIASGAAASYGCSVAELAA